MFLNPDQIEGFRRTGILVYRDFYDADTIATVSDWLDILRAQVPGAGKEAMYFETSPLSGESLLVRAEYLLGDHNPEITGLLLNEKTMTALQELLGEPALLFKDKVNYKLPNCRPDFLHQDQAAGWNAYSDYYISMGIAIDRNTVKNGAISFMQSGNYKKELMCEEWQPLTEADPPYQPEHEYLVLEAEPGDVIFFDSYVPHGSPSNRSTRSRRNLFLTFNRLSAGDHRAQYYRDKWASYPPNDREHIRSRESFRV